MAVFRPEDGVPFFAWRNTFRRVNERTYDWLYCRDMVTGPEGYYIQEIPFSDGEGETEYVRLIHERTFANLSQLSTYVQRMLRRYEGTHGGPIAPISVVESHRDAPHAETMYYADGVLYVPPPSSRDNHSDPDADPRVRDPFIAERWQDAQKNWPVLEHHVLHELAHHISGSGSHNSAMVQVLINLITLASQGHNFTDVIWKWETLLTSRLLAQGQPVVDTVDGREYGQGATVDDAPEFARPLPLSVVP